MPVPQVVPFGLLSVSVQTGAPVAQTFAASLHGFPVTVHAVHHGTGTELIRRAVAALLEAPEELRG